MTNLSMIKISSDPEITHFPTPLAKSIFSLNCEIPGKPVKIIAFEGHMQTDLRLRMQRKTQPNKIPSPVMDYNKLILRGSLIALIGYITSGPLGFIVVRLVKPQPAWTSASVFAENYHFIQDLPFYFGFLLTGGMLMLVTGHYLSYNDKHPEKKLKLLFALGWTIAFFTLIGFNYISQTTFVRHLALNYKPENDFAIATFSMANPLSFCWANEIWGYGFLGIATWLMAGYYSGRNNLIRSLLIANGIVSVGTIVFTIIDTNWLMTSIGLSAYFIWNVLMIALMCLICSDVRKLILTSSS